MTLFLVCAVTVLVTHAYTLVTAGLWRGLTRSRLVARSRLEFLRRVGIGGGAKAGADTAERMLLDIILKERVVRCRPQKPKFFGGAGEVAWLASEWIDGPPAFETVGLWGERSVRGVLVGAGGAAGWVESTVCVVDGCCGSGDGGNCCCSCGCSSGWLGVGGFGGGSGSWSAGFGISSSEVACG